MWRARLRRFVHRVLRVPRHAALPPSRPAALAADALAAAATTTSTLAVAAAATSATSALARATTTTTALAVAAVATSLAAATALLHVESGAGIPEVRLQIRVGGWLRSAVGRPAALRLSGDVKSELLTTLLPCVARRC